MVFCGIWPLTARWVQISLSLSVSVSSFLLSTLSLSLSLSLCLCRLREVRSQLRQANAWLCPGGCREHDGPIGKAAYLCVNNVAAETFERVPSHLTIVPGSTLNIDLDDKHHLGNKDYTHSNKNSSTCFENLRQVAQIQQDAGSSLVYPRL